MDKYLVEYEYKGYKYFVDYPTYEIFNKQGKSIAKKKLWSIPFLKDIIEKDIDEIDSKKIKRHISLVEDGSNNFDVWAESLYLGKVKKSGIDSYMCFPSNDRWIAYNAKDLHSMMQYFRGIESELKEEK